MLTIINLLVIDKIFNQKAIIKLSVNSKMLYLNCLTYYFKDKKATAITNSSFEINKSEIKKYVKFEPYFKELELSELLIIKENSICFINAWDEYIDKSLIEKVPVDSFVGSITLHSVEMHIEEIKKNETLIELFKIRYGIDKEEIKKLVEIFYVEQKTFDKKYNNYSDCIKHFTFWVASQMKNKPQKIDKTIKSQGKILGYE